MRERAVERAFLCPRAKHSLPEKTLDRHVAYRVMASYAVQCMRAVYTPLQGLLPARMNYAERLAWATTSRPRTT